MKSKRIISILLSIVMLLSVACSLDYSAYALSSSGKCGENVSYTFDKATGEIVISGAGDMYDYCDYDQSPFVNRSSIKKITIKKGVTSIGNDAFNRCANLQSVKIPSTVKEIGFRAFFRCERLTSVSVPDSVETIDQCAFERCTKLNKISLGNGIKQICNNAFLNCEYYNNSANWESSVLYIGSYLISAKKSISSCKIKKGTKVIAEYAFENCSKLMSITIPSTVTNIGMGAFDGTAYIKNSANWENKVLYIGNYLIKAKESLPKEYTVKAKTRVIADCAFYFCTKLRSITLPTSLVTIGYSAFLYSGLNTIRIPKNVSYIGQSALKTTKIKSLKVSVNNQFYSSSNNALYTKGRTRLIKYPYSSDEDKITIRSSVKEIDCFAFEYCKGIDEIYIPKSVEKIHPKAFENYFVKSYRVSSSNPNFSSKNGTLYNKNKTVLIRYPAGKYGNFTVPDSVTKIDNYAFYKSNLQSVTIGNNVKKIGYFAFDYCNSLEDVRIGSNVNSIGYCAFNNCEELKNVYYAKSKADWESIAINDGNDSLENAKIYYN